MKAILLPVTACALRSYKLADALIELESNSDLNNNSQTDNSLPASGETMTRESCYDTL